MNHHAFLTYSSTIEKSAVPKEFQVQSADVQHVIVDSFGIDEARRLQAQAGTKAVGEAGRVFVILTKSMTAQAQNALLKLFEEPPAQTQFYLVVSPEVTVIATLRSRLQVIDVALDAAAHDVFTSFAAASIAERLTTIAEKTKAKDNAWIRSIVTGALATATALPHRKSALLASQYASGPGASKKLLLEEIALSLPVK